MSEDPERDIVRRELRTDPEADDPAVQIAEVVAELEGTEATEISNMWEATNEVLQHMFSFPPREESQMRVEFSYERYRISVEQDGTAEFRKLTGSS